MFIDPGNVKAADYLAVAQQLLPPGQAWPRDPSATLTKYWGAVADECAKVHTRARDLLVRESYPGSAIELLPDWERVLGLPDACSTGEETLQERQKAAVAKIAARGGQRLSYYASIAAALGYAVAFDEFRPFICGLAHCGDALNGAPNVRFYWRVRVLEARVTLFRCGASRAGDLLGRIGRAADLECRLQRLKPAHTELIFSYEGA
jgi:uncharacterized protein YmfQ (DUF2313 family)